MYLLSFVVFIQLLLPPFWMTICYQWLDARWSGWQRLATLYRAAQEPAGRRFEKATVYLNAQCYRGIATVTMNSEGLYLRLEPAFFILHPPLLVPWTRLKAAAAGATTEFELTAAVPVRLRLTEPAMHEAVRQLEFHSPPDWRPMPLPNQVCRTPRRCEPE